MRCRKGFEISAVGEGGIYERKCQGNFSCMPTCGICESIQSGAAVTESHITRHVPKARNSNKSGRMLPMAMQSNGVRPIQSALSGKQRRNGK